MQDDSLKNSIRRIRTFKDDAAFAHQQDAREVIIAEKVHANAEKISAVLPSAAKQTAPIISPIFKQATSDESTQTVVKQKLPIDPNLKTNVKKIRTFKDDASVAQQHEVKVAEALPKKKKPNPPSIPAPQTKIAVTDQNIPQKISSEKSSPVLVQQKITATIEETYTHQTNTAQSTAQSTIKPEDIQKIATQQKASILSDNDSNDEQSLDGGKIISDRKRKRFKLLPAIYLSLEAFVTETYHALLQKKENKPMITKAEERIGVLKKAAQNSTRTPREDFSSVEQALKKVERKPVETSINIIQKSEVPEASWSHVVDGNEETIDIAEPVSAPQKLYEGVEFISTPKPTLSVKKETILTTLKSTQPIEQKLQTVPIVPVLKEVPLKYIAREKKTTIQDSILEEEPLPQTLLTEEKRVPEKMELLEAFIRPLPDTKQNQRRYAPARSSKKTSWLPSLALVGVVFFASVSGVATTYYVFTVTTTATPQVATTNAPTYIKAQASLSYILPQSRSELFTAITSLTQGKTGVTQTYPTVHATNGQVTPANVGLILDTLKFNQSDGFTRSIKEIAFGSIDGKYPFIIIKSTDFDTLFAGMLSWEKAMPQDLSTLLVTTTIHQSVFKDAIVYNKNIRVLQGENGEDVLVYAFINQQTVVIVQNRAMLQTLIPIIQ